MMLEISVPSKTFLLGEYVALLGGPSLILSTEPRFQLHVNQSPKSSSVVGIHPQSAAGKFLQNYADVFAGYQLEFIDPYSGLGGLGASSAQFVMVLALKHWLENHNQLLNITSFNEILTEYYRFAWDGRGIRPSGADVIAQIQGGISFFHKNANQVESLRWPFTEFSFCLIHTGTKLATHVHLQGLDQLALNKDVEEIVVAAKKALENTDMKSLAHAINEFSNFMALNHLVAETTVKLLKKISQQSGIITAKGCGSMGADVILVLLEKQHVAAFTAWAKQENLKLLSSDHQISAGLTITQ